MNLVFGGWWMSNVKYRINRGFISSYSWFSLRRLSWRRIILYPNASLSLYLCFGREIDGRRFVMDDLFYFNLVIKMILFPHLFFLLQLVWYLPVPMIYITPYIPTSFNCAERSIFLLSKSAILFLYSSSLALHSLITSSFDSLWTSILTDYISWSLKS